MANEAGRVDRETNYCTFKLSEPSTAAGRQGWLSTPRARVPGEASGLARAAAGSMVRGGGAAGWIRAGDGGGGPWGSEVATATAAEVEARGA